MSKGKTATLICQADSDFVKIEILDGAMRPVPLTSNLGLIEIDLPLGAYKVIFRSGSETEEQIVLLSKPGGREWVTPKEELWFQTAAPLYRTAHSHEYQNETAKEWSRKEPLARFKKEGDAGLLLMVRDTGRGESLVDNPARGLILARPDGRIAFNMELDGDFLAERRLTVSHVRLDAGRYLLQLATGEGRRLKQMIYLPEEWQTQIFLTTKEVRGGQRADLSQMSMLMAWPQTGFEPDGFMVRLTAKALQALAINELIPPAEESEMLFGKFDNPLIGLYGAHLYLRRPAINLGRAAFIFRNLYRLFGRVPHPDVLAFGWGALLKGEEQESDDPDERERIAELRRRLEEAGPIDSPPMLRASWDILLRASYTVPGLIPLESLTEQAAGSMLNTSPWLIWQEELGQTLSAQGGRVQSKGMQARLSKYPNRYAKFGQVSTGQALTLQQVSGPMAPPAESADAGLLAEIDDLLAQIDHHLRDGVDRRLAAMDPDGQLTDVERYLLQAAFPYLDRLAYVAYRRRGSWPDSYEQRERTTAASLIPHTRLPPSSLLRSLLEIQDKLGVADN